MNMLAVDLHKFFIDLRVARAEFLADTQHRLIHAPAGIHVDDRQVDGVGNTSTHLLAAPLDHAAPRRA